MFWTSFIDRRRSETMTEIYPHANTDSFISRIVYIKHYLFIQFTNTLYHTHAVSWLVFFEKRKEKEKGGYRGN